MKSDIIHLGYPADDHYREILFNLSPMSKISYRNQAKNSTLCWTSIHDIDITVTDDISKVTCKKCLFQIRKRGLI
jgi:hypothetical protein